MVSRTMLADIEMRLKEWRAFRKHPLKHAAFGGVGIVLAGDFGQLPPTKAEHLSLLCPNVLHGHLAALGIEEYIQAKTLKTEVKTEWTVLSNHVMFENWTKLEHRKPPTLPVDRRTGISVVEVGYSEAEAAEAGSRCLECSVNTIFDGSECILCNACVDVCPWDCLKIVSLDQLAGNETLHQVVEEHTGVPLAEITEGHEVTTQMAAMLKDDEACTRCALCAVRCPTDAITMEAFRFEEELTLID